MHFFFLVNFVVVILPRYDALVFIDECHATGFLGETGRGTEEFFGKLPNSSLLVGP